MFCYPDDHFDTIKDIVEKAKKEELEFNDKIANGILKIFKDTELLKRTKHRLIRKGILTFLSFEFHIDLEKEHEDRICSDYVSDCIKNSLEKELGTKVYPTLYIQKPIVYQGSYRLNVYINIETSVE